MPPRDEPSLLYVDSCNLWSRGADAICQKIVSLPFQKAAHVLVPLNVHRESRELSIHVRGVGLVMASDSCRLRMNPGALQVQHQIVKCDCQPSANDGACLVSSCWGTFFLLVRCVPEVQATLTV